jgi:NADH dehydrogenase
MILVTGANGYVGGYTLQRLKELLPESVRALVRSEAQFAKVHKYGAEPVLGDVTDAAALDRAMVGVDRVVHLAAVNRDKGNSTMQRINAEGTINVVEAAKRANVKHIVTLVGLGADSRKPYPLAQTQGAGVEYLMNSGVPYTVLESSVIFGAGDEFLNTLAGLARIPPVMIVPGDGQTRFQPIAVQDVATCVVKSLMLPAAVNRRLQICGSEVLTLEQIIDAILAEMHLSRIKVKMPVALLKIGVGVMDATLPKPPVTPSLLAQLGVDNVATDNATEKVFGVQPIKLREGIGFVREMTLGRLVNRTLGKADYR